MLCTCTILGIIYYFVFKGYKKEQTYVTEVEALKNIPGIYRKNSGSVLHVCSRLLFSMRLHSGILVL